MKKINTLSDNSYMQVVLNNRHSMRSYKYLLSIVMLVMTCCSGFAQISRTQIISNAAPFGSFAWTAHNNNIWNGANCGSGRSVYSPNWVTVGSHNTGMPYCWGGFNSINQYIAGMNTGKSAGDACSGIGSQGGCTGLSSTGCGAGCDCSGFVSEAWGLTYHCSTSCIPSISTAYSSYSQLLPGDCLNDAGSHVRLVLSYNHSGNGMISCQESCGSYWKNVFISYTPSQVTSYSPRYYIHVVNAMPPPNPTLTSSNSCGDKTLTRDNPPSGATFYWQGTNANGTNTGNSALHFTANLTGTHTYYLRAKYGNTWSTSSSRTVTVKPIPANPDPISATANPCGGQTLTRLAHPVGVTYFWQGTNANGTNTGSSLLTDLAPVTGIYHLRARENSGGCWSNASSHVAVIINPIPSPSIAGQNAVCPNSNGTLYSVMNSGNTFSWSVTGGTIASGQNTNSISVNWGSAGTGTATLTETNLSTGCSKTVSRNVAISSNLNPTITSSSSTNICQGQNVVLDASAGFNSYLWSNGATTQTITVASSGIFSVSVTSANGCSGSSTTPVTVTVNPNPSAAISPAGGISFCQGDSAVLTSSSTGIAAYSWSTGDITQSILVSDSGNYVVTVTDINGCSATSSAATVIVNAILPTPTPLITENNGTLTSSSVNGNQWYLNDTIIAGATTQNYTPAQNGSYTVSVNDSNGCSSASVSAGFNFNSTSVGSIAVSGQSQYEITLFPNPNNGNFKLRTSNPYNSLKVIVFNLLGEQIYFEQITNNAGEFTVNLHADGAGSISHGIYFVQIVMDGIVYNKKISVR